MFYPIPAVGGMRMGLGWSPDRSNWGPEYRRLGLFVLKK